MNTEISSLDKKSSHVEQQPQLFKRLKHFIYDVRSEIHKITWTNRDELFFYTKIVVLSTWLFGLAIYGLDLIIQGILNSLILLMHFISG